MCFTAVTVGIILCRSECKLANILPFHMPLFCQKPAQFMLRASTMLPPTSALKIRNNQGRRLSFCKYIYNRFKLHILLHLMQAHN